MSGSAIIILEDDIPLRDHYQLVLEAEGYGVAAADHSGHVLELIEDNAAVLVITDLFMPKHGGTKGIVEIIDRAHIPIIAVSAYANMIRIVSPLVAATLLKPITDKKLITTVSHVLRMATKQSPDKGT